MARDPDTIEREIEQARTALASTLDQLGEKASPKKLADSAKSSLRATLDEPKVKFPLIGSAALPQLDPVRRSVRGAGVHQIQLRIVGKPIPGRPAPA